MDHLPAQPNPDAALPAATTTAAGPGGEIVRASAPATPRSHAFSFGEPEPVLGGVREFWSYAQSYFNGRWFEPPISPVALAKTRHMSPHHASALKYKVNQLVRFFEPSPWLSRADFGEFALNFLAMGNGYLQRIDNLAGRPLRLAHSPAIWTRRGLDDRWFWAPLGYGSVPGQMGVAEFEPGSVFQLREAALEQEIYGIPEYLSALQSGLLNEAATIFRRRYYLNGSHAGFILYIGEEKFSNTDADALADALDKAKGPGNFRNLLLHIPGGKEKGVQVIPVGEAAAKDEFIGIKSTTRDDVLAAWRVPPVLLGVIPQNAGGFGDPAKAADGFHFAEIEPLQLRMLEVNDWLGVPAVAFRAYAPVGAGSPM